MIRNAGAYMPIDRCQAVLDRRALPDRAHGAVLFADIIGFTPLTEMLAMQLGLQRGAEQISDCLNQIYDTLIREVHRHGGSVIGLSGDAITCWFAGNAGCQAVACGLAMQSIMQRFSIARLPANIQLSLAMKVSVSTGAVRRFLVGDPLIQQLDVLAGHTLDIVAEANHLASASGVVVDRATLAQLGAHTPAEQLRQHADREYATIGALDEPIEISAWPEQIIQALDEQQIRAWLLPPIYERLRGGSEDLLAELRPAVALFLAFDGIDYDADEDAGRLLDAYIRHVQRAVADFEGCLIDVTMGDKGSYLYIAFGAPLSHDDDAMRAIAAAQTLRQLPPELGFITNVRIGIAQGQMYTGIYGGSARRSYGVLGNKVNLAARLMQLAGPGAIYCDQEVYRHTRHYWSFEALPAAQIKGKAERIPIYRPTVQHNAHHRLFARANESNVLIGRAGDVARLRGLLEAQATGKASILYIEGEAGIGKSRLVVELARLAAQRGFMVLQGAGQSIEQYTPYRAWIDIFSAYFALEGQTDAEQRRERVAEIAQRIAPNQRQRLPLLNDLLQLHFPETSFTTGLDPVLRQEHVMSLLVALLFEQSARQPLVVVIDDAHWLDSLSWMLAAKLAHALPGAQAPLLLVVALRPLDDHDAGAEPAAVLRSAENTTIIELNALPRDELIELAANRLQVPSSGLPGSVADMVYRRSGGNPFFAEEFVYTLHEQGLIAIEPDPGVQPSQWRCRVVGDLRDAERSLPTTLQGLILNRIDRLPSDEQLILKIAAVIGRSFAYTPLRYALNRYTPIADRVLQAQLGDLARRNLTELADAERDPTYTFKHVITQETAYQTLLFAQRKQIHRTVAEWYEQTFGGPQEDPDAPNQLAVFYTLLAHHYHHAEDRDQERRYARLAGQRAAAQHANAEALTYLGRAYELTPIGDYDELYALLIAREQVLDLQGDREAQGHDLGVLAGLAEARDDDRCRAEVALRRSTYANMVGDFTEAAVLAEQAIGLAQTAGAVELEAAGYQWWGLLLWVQGHPDAQLELEHALELARQHQLTALEARTVAALGNVAWSKGQYLQAQTYYGQTIALLLKSNNQRGASTVINNLGMIAENRGDYTNARAYYEQALHMKRDLGDRRGEAKALTCLGSLLDTHGQYRQARDYFEQALQIYHEIAGREGQGEVLQYLGLLEHHMGDNLAARSYAERALRIAEELAVRDDQAHALCIFGNALVALGDLEAARQAYQRSLELRRELEQPNLAIDPLAGLARAALAAGDLAQARAYVSEIAEYLAENAPEGADEPLRAYLTCYEILREGDVSRANTLLAAAHTMLQDRASKIDDPADRQSFLEQVAAHRAITNAFAAMQP